jgi:hypothetical protein
VIVAGGLMGRFKSWCFRWLWGPLLLFLAFGCPFAMWGAIFTPLNGIRLERLEFDMQENLPIGSSREQVQHWLESHSIKFVDIIDLDHNRKGGFSATIPNRSFLLNFDIYIQFYFDQNNRVEKRNITRTGYCL